MHLPGAHRIGAPGVLFTLPAMPRARQIVSGTVGLGRVPS